jgi:glycosyltransferase involved in cell wall biosynthesis
MRVALVTFGGNEAYSIQLANSLANKAEILLVEPKNSRSKAKTHLGGKVTLFQYSQTRMRYPTSLITVRKIFKRIIEFDADVVHFQGGNLWFFAVFPFMKRMGLVSTFHDVTEHVGEEKIKRKWIKWLFRKYSDKIIVHGDFLKGIMMNRFGVEDSRIAVVPHGNYDLYSRWIKADIYEEKGTILFFGRLYKYKGLEYLIKAEPIISKEISNLKIIVAVHGDPFSKYEKYVVNKDSFEIIDKYILDEEVAALFQKASVVVLPYIEASQSGVLNIAYTFGKPVVVTNVGSLPEVVDDGKTGFIVPPKDSKALADALVTLLKDEKLRRKMVKNAYKKASIDFSWERIAEMTIEVYRTAIEEKENLTIH